MLHPYLQKQLQYESVANFIMIQKLKTVQMEEQQLNMLPIQKIKFPETHCSE